MGCCLSRENKDGSPLKYNTIHENGLDTRGLLFKVSNQNQQTTILSEPSDSILNRSNYNKPNLTPISINDENNISDAPLKLKREDVLEILLTINSFDFMCNAVNFFNHFSCDFNPELLITFEDKSENFAYEKNVEIDVDEDYLNKSGQFQAGLLGMSKKKSMSNFSNVNNTIGETISSTNNRPPTPITPVNNPNGEKKIKQYYFENNLFRIPEINYNKLSSMEKNSFINFSLFQKNKRDQNIKFIIGEGYIPANFLYSFLKEESLEIPIYNHIEDIFLGNLSVKIIAKFIPGDTSIDSKEKLETLQSSKSHQSASINEFLKFQFLNLHDYGKILRKAFNNETEIPSLYDYNLFKIQLHNIIQKFIKSNNQKEEALRELYEFFYEYVDTGNTNTSFNLETVGTDNCSLRKSSTNTMLTTLSTTPPTEAKKKYRLDFKTLNQTKYFIFVCILNEILIKCDNSDNNFTLLKSSKFLNEKIIFSAYETSKNENKNYLLAENVVSLLLNIRKNSSNPFDPRYKIDYILAYFGNYFKKSTAHYLTFLEKSGIRMQSTPLGPIKKLGPVSNESFIVFRNLIYKFLKLVRITLDNKNENLEQKELKESNPAKYQELVDLASQDVEAMKRNHFYFLSTKDVIVKKDKTTVEKEFLYVNDINYVIGILNIFYSYIKLAKNLAKNHLRILPVEFYIQQLLGEKNSEFLNFVALTMNIFYKNIKYFNLILDITYELFSEAYGIFIFNFFKKVDVNIIFNAFSVDAKYIDSRKFNSWNSLFIIMSKSIKLIKKSECEGLDFISLKWENIYNQILSLNTILQKNHYFKIPDEIDLEFDANNNFIILKNSKVKYMTNKLSVKIQNKFFEIFHDFCYIPDLIAKTRKNDNKTNKTFTKIFMRIVFLILLKIDGNLVDIVKSSTEYFFKSYMNILYILSNLKKSVDFNLADEVSFCLSNIFPSASNTVIDNFRIGKFVSILENKIKSMAPSKFDHKASKLILENLIL